MRNPTSFFSCLLLCVLVLGSGLLPRSSVAQQHSQPFVTSPQVLGMGGTAGAFPTTHAALFYNPAHLTSFDAGRAPITLIGVNLAFSSNLPGQFDFYRDELEPLLGEGLTSLTSEEEQALYDDIFRLGQRPSQLNGTVLLPSFVMNSGRYGFGGGFFFRSSARNRIGDSGSGIPFIDFTGIGDAIGIASGAINFTDLGLPGLSAGITGKLTQRYATVKSKPVDILTEDENLLIFKARTFDLDVGLLYEAVWSGGPGHLNIGLTGYNLLGADFNYKIAGTSVTQNSPITEAEIEAEKRLLQDGFQTFSSFRLGTAYVIPDAASFIGETAFAIDLVGAPGSGLNRSVLTRLCLGAQTSINDWFFVRAGLNQGYTTVGFGFDLMLVRIDYAYYGIEEGRLPGQLPSWRHSIQLLLGSF